MKSSKKNDTQFKNYTNDDSKAKIQMMKQMIQKKIQMMIQIQKRRFK